MNAQELIDAIEDAGYETRSYSGRGMCGAVCVGVDLESVADLWDLAVGLGQADIEIGAPRTDSMGLGIIAYWPSVKWPSEQAA